MHHHAGMKRKRTGLAAAFALALAVALFSIRSTGQIPVITSRSFLSFASAHSISQAFSLKADAAGPALIPFAALDRAGYIDPERAAIYTFPYSERIAIDASGWIQYDQLGELLEIEKPGQVPLTLRAFAYPWFHAGRRFLLRADQMALAEIDDRGTIVWEHEFPMIITALDASADLAAAGLLDGSIVLMGRRGAVSYLKPDNSRGIASTVYGLALSSDGKMVAVIRGMSPKRIELFAASGTMLQKKKECLLPSNAPHQATAAFSDDGSHVIAAMGGELYHYDVRSNRVVSLASDMGQDGNRAYTVLGPAGRQSIAVLAAAPADSGKDNAIVDSCAVWVLRHGEPILSYPGAVGFSASKQTLAFVTERGVDCMKGEGL